MQTTTTHRIFDGHGAYLEVQEQSGQVTLRRVYDDSDDGFHVSITIDEFRAIVDLLKPFANAVHNDCPSPRLQWR